MKGIAHRTKRQIRIDAFKFSEAKIKERKLDELKLRKKREEQEFKKIAMSVNKYLTYREDSIYIKKGALSSLLKIARKKWGLDTL